MSETGFYALGTWGAELGRVVAVARHVPDAVVYVKGRAAARNLFAYHDVRSVIPRCSTPGCVGLAEADLHDWMKTRNPDRLVMDAHPYGPVRMQIRQYIESRSNPTFVLHRDTRVRLDDTSPFAAVIKTEPSPVAGINLHPILPFDSDELPTRTEARAALGGGDHPIVMIIGEGTTPNYRDYVIRLCQRRGLDHVIVATYPTMTLMPGADLVVGYAGYNQDEAAAVGVPMAAIGNLADPHPTWRATTTPTQLAATVHSLQVREAAEIVTYPNHARRAASLIEGYPDWETVDG